MPINQENSPTQPRIVRGYFDSLSLYEITDYELEQLSQGAPSSTYLNFSIFFLSVAIAFLTTLLTVNITDRIFTVFVLITIVGFSFGVVLLILWFRTRTRISKLVEKIKARAISVQGKDILPAASQQPARKGKGKKAETATEAPTTRTTRTTKRK